MDKYVIKRIYQFVIKEKVHNEINIFKVFNFTATKKANSLLYI